MSKQFIFQFGNNPKLSEAEISTRLSFLKRVSQISEQFSIYKGTIGDKIQAQKFLDTLGGTIRIGEIFFEGEFKDLNKTISEHLTQKFSKDKKNIYGITSFPKNENINKKLLIQSKKDLKKLNFSSRFLNRNFKNLDAGTLHKEKLFKKGGIEICIHICGERIYLSSTLAVQDIEKFSKRDYKKPVRNMQVGMLPIKIALMMLNLTVQDRKFPNSIWDPFCGTGTILSEAALLGIENLHGSDLELNRIKDSQKNLDYFKKIWNPTFKMWNLFQHNAKELLSKPIEADAVCTETYLGPIFSKPLSQDNLTKAKTIISPILEKFFLNLHQNFTGNIAVVAIPFWRLKNKNNSYLEKPLDLARKFWKNAVAFDYNNKERKSFLFRRPEQNVGREIFVLKRRI